MNDNLYDILEACLQELENGVDVEELLKRHPEYAEELRPILSASIQARSIAVPAPSTDIVRRNRAKLMQRAAEMREAKAVPRKRFFPLFQRLAIVLSLLVLFLASGTRLVHASSTALPGENLYPVKRTWEDLRLLFVFNQQLRESLKEQYEVERLDEVNELLAKGRGETIQFAGVFKIVNNKTYVSGIQVILPAAIPLPANGSVVMISGSTNAQGFVEIISLDLLPDGSIVPAGQPIEVETESNSDTVQDSNVTPNQNSNSGSGSGGGSSSGAGEASSGNDSLAGGEAVSNLELKGTIDSVSGTNITINGRVFSVESFAAVAVNPGDKVEVKGYFDKNGQFVITEIKVEDFKSGSGSGKGDSGEDSSSDSGSSSGDSSSSGGDDHGGSSGGGGSDDH
jgi:uncharacterized membrane protein YgcG